MLCTKVKHIRAKPVPKTLKYLGLSHIVLLLQFQRDSFSYINFHCITTTSHTYIHCITINFTRRICANDGPSAGTYI